MICEIRGGRSTQPYVCIGRVHWSIRSYTLDRVVRQFHILVFLSRLSCAKHVTQFFQHYISLSNNLEPSGGPATLAWSLDLDPRPFEPVWMGGSFSSSGVFVCGPRLDFLEAFHSPPTPERSMKAFCITIFFFFFFPMVCCFNFLCWRCAELS